ncbi:MAG: hypothetical protein WKG07_44030 [Hymenobacter sp.]
MRFQVLPELLAVVGSALLSIGNALVIAPQGVEAGAEVVNQVVDVVGQAFNFANVLLGLVVEIKNGKRGLGWKIKSQLKSTRALPQASLAFVVAHGF